MRGTVGAPAPAKPALLLPSPVSHPNSEPALEPLLPFGLWGPDWGLLLLDGLLDPRTASHSDGLVEDAFVVPVGPTSPSSKREPSLVGEGMDDGMEEMSGRRNRVSVLRQAIFSTAGAAELEELWHDLTGSQ